MHSSRVEQLCISFKLSVTLPEDLTETYGFLAHLFQLIMITVISEVILGTC